MTPPANDRLARGDVRLLETEVARRLLASRIPARPPMFLAAQVDQPRTRMARIDLRPAWVGVLDFASRLPRALGGINKETE
jgi:hypothetical protein